MTSILIHIKAKSPYAFFEFEQFITENYGDFMKQHHLSLQDLPNAMCVGIFLAFFHNQNIDFTIGSVDDDIVLESIIITMEDYEKVISHYS